MTSPAELKKEFGARLKSLRVGRNITQQVLAKELGMSFGGINKIERGKSFPQPITRQKLAQFFGTDDLLESKLTSQSNQSPTRIDARTESEEKARVCAKLAPELIDCMYKFLMKGQVTVDQGGALKKSGG